MKDKKISFIIVNYNYKEDIKKLISSLAVSIQESQYEIVIVDNGSTDGSKTYFSSLNGNIVYLYLDTNVGYGAANNRGVELSSGAVIVLINPDTLVQEKGSGYKSVSVFLPQRLSTLTGKSSQIVQATQL